MSNVVERMTVQAAGAIGAIRASVRGLGGIFSRLSEEHRENIALLEQTAAADDPATCAELWTNARNELLAHERAEREYLYAELGRQPKLAAFTTQHESEAAVLESSVAAVEASKLSSEEWRVALDRLEQQLREHAKHEEDFFIVAQEVLGVERAKELEGLYTNGRRSILHELKAPSDSDPADGR